MFSKSSKSKVFQMDPPPQVLRFFSLVSLLEVIKRVVTAKKKKRLFESTLSKYSEHLQYHV